jgi:hypothetical protein
MAGGGGGGLLKIDLITKSLKIMIGALPVQEPLLEAQ